jgi:hypothetical protein
MYSEELEMLIDAALEDCELTEKEKQVLFKRAQAEGIDLDEFEMIVDAKLLKKKKAQQANEVSSAPLQSNKVGEVKKCPACGAIYIPGTAVCTECGHVFMGSGPTRSSVLLFETLQAFNKSNAKTDAYNKDYKGPGQALGSVIGNMGNSFIGALKQYAGARTVEEDLARRKFDVIQSFPVPNYREDLIDFLTSIQPKADPNAPKTGVDQSFSLHSHTGKKYSENLGYAYWLLYSNCIQKAKISFANDPDFAPFFAFYNSKTVKEEKRGVFGRRK